MENSNNNSEDSPILLTDSIISSLKTCKLIKKHEAPINNISINTDGSLYLTSGKMKSYPACQAFTLIRGQCL